MGVVELFNGAMNVFMNLVTVYRTFSPADAQLICSRLDAAQLHAMVANELSAMSIDGYALAAGGVLVQVPEEEAADAREIIASADSTPPNSP
jgi:hypothetical protein